MNTSPVLPILYLAFGLLLNLFGVFFWRSGLRFQTHRSLPAKRRRNWAARFAFAAGILFFILALAFGRMP